MKENRVFAETMCDVTVTSVFTVRSGASYDRGNANAAALNLAPTECKCQNDFKVVETLSCGGKKKKKSPAARLLSSVSWRRHLL